MGEESNTNGYGIIFKTTFLFGFVQVLNILVKIIINKVVAMFLGANGMGIISFYNSSINMLKTGAGLGISQSAVRDISEAHAGGNNQRFSFIISLTRKVVIFTAILGLFVTIILSPLLSKWNFNNNAHIVAYVWLSIVVAVNIISEGQLAILKGMRQMRALAKSSLYGSIMGLAAAVSFYYFFREDGIIPSLFITAFSTLLFSSIYVSNINYERVRISIKETFLKSSLMLKMGISLMIVSFMGSLFDIIISSYISHTTGLSDVGIYHAGAAIITSYFGIILTSMSTDYYPRISAVYRDNKKLEKELNRQSEAGLIIVFPLVILFVFFSSFFIKFLYSEEFIRANYYTDYAMIGTIIIIVSNCMGMILLAKQDVRIFLISVIGQRVLLVVIFMCAYSMLGLKGLGVAYIIQGFLHFLVMGTILHHFYKIHIAKRVLALLAGVIVLILLSMYIREIDYSVLRYTSGLFILIASCIASTYYMKHIMEIDLMCYIRKKLNK